MKKSTWLLLGIFALSLCFRLFFSFQTSELSDSESYYVLRQVESIMESGRPLFNDPLSYGGRKSIFVPFYYYFLAAFSFLMKTSIVLKILPAILSSTLVFATYLLSKELTKSQDAAIFSSFLSAFVPVILEVTVNSATEFSFLLPGTLFLMYFVIRISSKPEDLKHLVGFMLLFLALSLSSSYTVIFIIGILFYLVVSKLEGLLINRAELELALFSTFLFFWIQLLFYKRALFFHGPAIIWQNVPSEVLRTYFQNFNVLEAVYKIGILPFLFGVYAIYHNFHTKRKNVFLLIGFTFSAGILLWLRLIELRAGLLFLGCFLVVIFSTFFKNFFIYVAKTKLSRFKTHLIWLFILLFFFSSVVPSAIYAMNAVRTAPDRDVVLALEWIKQNTHPDSVILSSSGAGHIVTAIAKRKNTMDSNFILIDDVNKRFSDIRDIYTTPYKTTAITLLNAYSVDYILFSSYEKTAFGAERISYVDDECFRVVYDSHVKVYQSLCEMSQ